MTYSLRPIHEIWDNSQQKIVIESIFTHQFNDFITIYDAKIIVDFTVTCNKVTFV